MDTGTNGSCISPTVRYRTKGLGLTRPVCRVVEELIPVTQKHDIEGLMMGRIREGLRADEASRYRRLDQSASVRLHWPDRID